VKVFPLIGAALVALATAARWRRLSNGQRALWLAVAAGLAVYGSGVIKLPNIEELIKGIGETLGEWTYALVGALAFLETGAFVGLVAPGEFTIILGGVIAGQGEISVIVLIGVVWIAAVAGDTTSFFLGRKLGRGFLERHGPKVKITEERLKQVESFFERHGGATILIGRFVGLVRALAPFVAGTSNMRFRRFIPFDVVGAGLWGTTFVVLGYIFWQSFSQLVVIAKQGAFALGTIIVVIVGAIAGYRWLRVPDNRAKAERFLQAQADRPAVRPVVAVLRPVWRRGLVPAWRVVSMPLTFALRRVTPGQLGLELTTLLAVAAVGSFGFVGSAILVEEDPVPVTDLRAFELAARFRTSILNDLAEVISLLGSLPVVGALALATVVFLLARRRVLEAVTLLTASVLTYAGVHFAKVAEGRPRPLGALVETEGSAFPSGHAAYAVAYVAIAIALARAVPWLAGRVAVVLVAVALAAAVGISRVYLRAHYLSDVLAGAGLGATVFAVCGMVALIVGFLRNNAKRE